MSLTGTDGRSRYLRALMAVSALMVFCTLLNRISRQKFGFVYPFDLSNENIVAAWWSGSLLLLGALHAADGYFRLKQTHFKAALAWAVVASLLFGLSADEVGSFHERAADVLGMGEWLSFLPFALILVGASAWAFWTLWRAPLERRSVPWLILGFVILASVAGQEYLEHNLDWPWYVKPFRSAFEEGSELVGMVLIIHTCMRNSEGLFSNSRGPAFSAVYGTRFFALFAAACAVFPMAHLTASLPDQEIGHPSDWLTSTIYSLAAAWLLHVAVKSSGATRQIAKAIGWLLFVSAMTVQLPPLSAIELAGWSFNTRQLVIALALFGVAEALRQAGRQHSIAMRGWIALAALSLVVAATVPHSLLASYGLGGLLALVGFGAQVFVSRNALPSARPFPGTPEEKPTKVAS
jgi:hypothetical protein